SSVRFNFTIYHLQIFVISNGMSSRYFSNNDGELNKNFIFNWSDENNRWIDEIEPFTASFLSPLNIHEMISKYTIFDADQKVMKIMRPYQVYAQKSIMSQAEIHPATNGYVWHTTGSGKTITAFKAASQLALHTDAQKIIFLVDIRDLDSQTINNFNAYLPRRADGQSSIDRTDNTSVLVEQLKNSTDTLIVTTIQKLANAVKNPRHRSVLEPYKEQRVIFIEDEAHRTQFGEMRKQINSWFKNAQHFGFTGTPIFKENIGADGRTTDDIYDIRLHTYLIRDAVRDHNVLPFNVTYINTIHSKEDIENLNGEVEALNIKEVYENEKRLNQIAQHIILNHSSKTYNRQYNAIFAVSDT
ncbi:DEAD/DEAH box helicase family protein, partial [Leuconostoc mesenteroides]